MLSLTFLAKIVTIIRKFVKTDEFEEKVPNPSFFLPRAANDARHFCGHFRVTFWSLWGHFWGHFSSRPFEVLLGDHQVVVLGDLPGMTQPRMDDVGRILLHQLRLAAGTQVDEEFGPWRHLGSLDSPNNTGIDVALVVKTVG